MKLVRFGDKGQERPGLLQQDGIVDLRRIFSDIPDIGEDFFRQGWLERLSGVDRPADIGDARLASPVSRPSKIICLGINYAEHSREASFERPAQPLLFCKTPNALNGPFDPIALPQSSGQVDWEVELAVIISHQGKRIPAAEAYRYVAGYSVMNDVSARAAQFSDGQWFRGKSFDTFAPLGPALVTGDEVGDPGRLQLSARVNGVLMQEGDTGQLIFDIPAILAFVSQDITLMPGDVISTGTPSGVGIFRDPPVTLQPGDVVACEVEKIGVIRNRCVQELSGD
jgi:2-keto-4-pentenoate hydratase/2-oxohepta-3-ene-1,7-dioic acid hydratase in catechol pathway